MMAILKLSILLVTTLNFCTSTSIEIMNQWSFLKFNIPFTYPLLRNYVPENTVFTSLEISWDRVFLATPRLWPGNPATVSWIPRNSFENTGEQGPLLQVSYFIFFIQNLIKSNPIFTNGVLILSPNIRDPQKPYLIAELMLLSSLLPNSSLEDCGSLFKAKFFIAYTFDDLSFL